MAIILDIVYCVLFSQTERLFINRCKKGKVNTQLDTSKGASLTQWKIKQKEMDGAKNKSHVTFKLF
jgi:hypothetical protein